MQVIVRDVFWRRIARGLVPLAMACAWLLCAGKPVEAQSSQAFYLKDGDRVVFYGDSITQQGYYSSAIEDFVVTRHPEWNVVFVNSGWSGDWAVGGGGGKAEVRVARDVLAHHPTVVTTLLGMNDGAYQKFDQAFFDVFADAYRKLLNQIQAGAPAARITLLEPTPYEEITRTSEFPGYNETLIRYGKFVGELGQEKKLLAIDLNTPLLNAIRKAHGLNPELSQKLIPDRIHPSPVLGLLVASVILRNWNATPTVSAVEVNAQQKKIISAENTFAELSTKDDGVAWTQKDNALPLPLAPADPLLKLLLQSSEQIQEGNRQVVKITGLKTGDYTLSADGEVLGTWAASTFASGINLAFLESPMLRQAREVHALTERLLAIRLARWQGVEVGLEKENPSRIEEAERALDALRDELLTQRRAMAQPKPHRFEVTAAQPAAQGTR